MSSCKNCSNPITENANYCNHCGAKVIHNRLTVRNIFNDFSEQFLNWDNKLFNTFVAMITNPESVIKGYIGGIRKKYVNVLSYFAIAITISGLQIYILNKFYPEAMDLSSITTSGMEEYSKKNLEFFQEYQSILMMLYAPLYAIIAHLVFLTLRRYNFAEHTVMFMYILSQISIIGAILSVLGAMLGYDLGSLSAVLLIVQIGFSTYCLQRIYRLTTEGIILRTLLFFLILGILFIGFMIVFMIIMFKTGMMDDIIEAQRKAKEISYIISSAMNWTS